MPYKIEQRGKKFCVIRSDTGIVKSCKFYTKEKAESYRKFLDMQHAYESSKGKKPREGG